MSIQELYEISKFLNVPENEWQNFIPNQLSHGSPAAMSWIISLVKSSRKKDTEIDKLTDEKLSNIQKNGVSRINREYSLKVIKKETLRDLKTLFVW